MPSYNIETLEKKNVYVRTEYQMPDEGIAAGKTFYSDEWYRWGRCTVISEEKPTVSSDPYTYPLELDDYEMEDHNLDDGCSLFFEYDDADEWTEEEKAYVEELWDNGEFYDTVYISDSSTSFYGPLEVTEA